MISAALREHYKPYSESEKTRAGFYLKIISNHAIEDHFEDVILFNTRQY